MKKPSQNPYVKNTNEYNLWKKGYNHGLKESKNKVLVPCPVQTRSVQDIQLIWDQGFVAGRKDQMDIPDGPYCYTPESGLQKDENGRVFMKVKPCPYYGNRTVKDSEKSTIGTMGLCKLTRTVDDILLSDQCKICGVKDE